MSISIIHQLSMSILGGVETLFHDYLTQPNNSNFKHHLLITAPHIIPEYKPILYKHADSINYAKYWNGLKVPKWPKVLRRMYQNKLFKEKNPNIALFWNNFVKNDWREAAKKNDSLIVYYDHGNAFAQPHTELAREYFKDVDAAITCSYASKRILELRWGFKGDIYVVTNPLRSTMQVTPKQPKEFPKNRPLKIGSVGRMVPAKGFALGLHVTKILLEQGVDVEFHIAGEGSDQKMLMQTAQKMGISNKVIFHGLLYDLTKFYNQIDIYFSGSVREAFGLVIIEAAAHGCPIIGPRIDGVPEIVKEDMGYCLPQTLPISEFPRFDGGMSTYSGDSYDPKNDCLVKPAFVDPAHMSEAILKLVNDHALYSSMSKACFKNANENFKFSSYVNNLETALSKIAKKNS